MNEKTPKGIAKEILESLNLYDFEACGKLKSDIPDDIATIATAIHTERAVADELRKENTALRIFAKKAVKALQDIKDELCVPRYFQPKCPVPIAKAYRYADTILTDPVAVAIMKEKV